MRKRMTRTYKYTYVVTVNNFKCALHYRGISNRGTDGDTSAIICIGGADILHTIVETARNRQRLASRHI